MKTIHLRGLLWLLSLLGFGYLALSLEPGFLDFDNLPDTNFSCVGKVIGGYYADLETNCQMFHVCTIGQLDEPMDIRFLCLNGTVFDQETRVCERIDEVDCAKSEQFYSLNLELYGNTQPSVLEESADTDQPIIIKASTTTTTTTTQRPKTKTTRPPTTTPAPPKVISTHHFPISSRPDIRFNPEEINISLNPDAPPSIQSVFAKSPDKQDLLRVLANTQRPQVATTQQIKVQPPATPADINYGFTSNQEYHTEPQTYQYHHARHGQFRNQFKTTTYRTQHVSTTPKHIYKEPTTYRTTYVSSLKPVYSFGTEKPQRLQLPLPLLPTLPPLTFSSPAPFSLGHHVENKRYTNDHQPPPRIIISASASVSDASGRRLNYSLGTIGVTPVLEETQKSYDDYKDHDVVLDPFYHDVPKIKTKRRKRQVQHSDVIRNEQEAVDVLKFLFDWYQNHQKASTAQTIRVEEINEQLAPIAETPIPAESQNITEDVEVVTKDEEETKKDEVDYDFKESDLFKRKSKFNIVGDVLSITENTEEAATTTESTQIMAQRETDDYIDDNYEAKTDVGDLKEEVEVVEEINKNVTVTEEPKVENETIDSSFAAQFHEEMVWKDEDNSETEENLDQQTATTEIALTTDVVDLTTTTTTTTTTVATTTEDPRLTRRRNREKARQEKLRGDNRKKYSSSYLSGLKPRVRGRDKPKTTTEPDVVEPEAPTTIYPTTVESSQPSTSDDQNFVTTTESAVTTQISFEFGAETTEAVDDATTTLNNFIAEEAITPEINSFENDSSHAKHILVESPETPKNENNKERDEATTQSFVKDETIDKSVTVADVPEAETIGSTLDIINASTELVDVMTTRFTASTDTNSTATEYHDIIFQSLTTTAATSTTGAVTDEIIATNLTPVDSTTTETPIPTSTTIRPTRPYRRNSYRQRKPTSRHRFSTEFTPKPTRRRPVIEDEIIEALTSHESPSTTQKIDATSSRMEDVPDATDAPLSKSANPTQAESAKESFHTTPLSMTYKLHVRKEKLKSYIFNCFGKTINRFYSDPRDCRLFHYCTSGYTKNQLLDMKFVCDLGTYFDEDKLICTKTKPKRCL